MRKPLPPPDVPGRTPEERMANLARAVLKPVHGPTIKPAKTKRRGR